MENVECVLISVPTNTAIQLEKYISPKISNFQFPFKKYERAR